MLRYLVRYGICLYTTIPQSEYRSLEGNQPTLESPTLFDPETTPMATNVITGIITLSNQVGYDPLCQYSMFQAKEVMKHNC